MMGSAGHGSFRLDLVTVLQHNRRHSQRRESSLKSPKGGEGKSRVRMKARV